MRPPGAIGRAMQTAVDEGVFPGAVLLVRLRGVMVYRQAVGFLSSSPRGAAVSLGTVYDLASLTKPLGTATALLCLVQDRRLDLDIPLQNLLDEFDGSPIGQATVSHLLTHSSGLPGWRPLYEHLDQGDRFRIRQVVLSRIRDEPLIYPIGQKSVYSDLGFILLGYVVEYLCGQSLSMFCHERIFKRIGAAPLGFLETKGQASGQGEKSFSGAAAIAPTEHDEWRGRLLQAEVHDENAYALGGTAGHAGLFGTAEAVLAVSAAWLNGYKGRQSILSQELVLQFVTRRTEIAESSWALGWDTPSIPSSSGTRFSPRSFGHLGYTGTSLWIDPTCELEVVLLSNRVHPTRRNEKIRQFRPLIHDLIYSQLIGTP
ncbi:MAG: serine hydrolase domain-containing protein [Nitrospiraceae bacterium]